MSFNASKAYLKVKENYLRFVIDRSCGAFPNQGDDVLWNESKKYLDRIWTSDIPSQSLFATPIIEGLFPYPMATETPQDLINHGILDERMQHFFPEWLKHFYIHQQTTIERSQHKNIIVSSGTGSGKTECFLYSMLNNLYRSETEEQLHQTGVRIILIYPMNALVKDQLQRIVKLLSCQNLIKVGMYTHETVETEPAPNHVRAMRSMTTWQQDGWNNGNGCYVYSRNKLRDTPPHILITNYSMLEYAMLRQQDNDLFSNKLQAVVLDEAHLYSGLLGNDITMLIKRLLIRCGKTYDQVRFYATSATIGNPGDDQESALREAAAKLFGVPEETVCPIVGDRQFPDAQIQINADDIIWGNATREEKEQLIALRNELINDEMNEHPRNILPINSEQLKLLSRDEPPTMENTYFLPYKLHTFFDSPRQFFSDMVVTDATPLGNLQTNPLFANNLTGLQIFTTNDEYRKDFYFKAKFKSQDLDGNIIYRIFSAESTEEGDIVYFRMRANAENQMSGFDLTHYENENTWKIELRGAGNGHFVFALKSDELLDFDWLKLKTHIYDSEWYSYTGFKLSEFSGNMDENNEQSEGEIQNDIYNTTKSMLMPLGFVPAKLRATVIAELLMPYLPDASGDDVVPTVLPWRGRQLLFFSDSRAKAAESAVNIQTSHNQNLIRSYIYQLLSNNEGTDFYGIVNELNVPQIAAQFSLPQYILSSAANNDLPELKRLFLATLVFQEIGFGHQGGRNIESLGLMKVDAQLPDANDQCYQANDSWNTLCNLIPGRTVAEKLGNWISNIFPDLIDVFRMTRHVRFLDYENVFIQESRVRGRVIRAIRGNNQIVENKADVIKNAAGYAFSDLKNKSFVSCKSLEGSVFMKDFIRKHFFPQNSNLDNDQIKNCIDCIFTFLRDNFTNGNNPLFYLRYQPEDNHPNVPILSLNVDNLLFYRDEAAFQANNKTNKKCRNDVEENARDVTVVLKKSYGYQEIVSHQNFIENEHGELDFDASLWGGLRVPEHSAQLKSDKLAEIEEAFKKHEINVISCTPTMEVGVDIGGLSVIVQGNLPPEKSNYVQRSGRSGRRGEPSALVTTFIGNSLFDSMAKKDSLSVFNRLNLFAPADVKAEGTRDQVKQHIFQFFLGIYCRYLVSQQKQNHQNNNPIKVWDSVGNFMSTPENIRQYNELINDANQPHNEWNHIPVPDNQPRCSGLLGYLQEQYNTIRENFSSLIANTSLAAKNRIEQEIFNELIYELQRKLNVAAKSLNDALKHLSDTWQNIQGNDERTERFRKSLQYQFRDMMKEMLISWLIHHRILPSYAFPIDVVSFYPGKSGEAMERDKFTALNEFVPESALTMEHKKVSVDALTTNIYNIGDGSFSTFSIATCPYCHAAFEPLSFVGQITCKHCGKQFLGFDEDNVDNKDKIIEQKELPARNQEELSRGNVIRYIVPQGYRSLGKSEDATVTRKGRIWTKTETKLLLADTTIQQKNGLRPANVQFFVNKEVDAIAINRGRYNRGYIISQFDGRIISSRKNDDDNQQWIRDNVPREHDVVYGALAFKTKVHAWICAIPTWGNDLIANSHKACAVRTIIMTALHKAAATRLNLDERILRSYIQNQQMDAVLFCLYDLSGKAGNINIIFRNRKDIFNDALKLIEKCTSRINCDALLTYSSARDLANLTDTDFQNARQWVQDNCDTFIAGENDEINGINLQGGLNNSFPKIINGNKNAPMLFTSHPAEERWQPYDGHAPVFGQHYKLSDGSIIVYNIPDDLSGLEITHQEIEE